MLRIREDTLHVRCLTHARAQSALCAVHATGARTSSATLTRMVALLTGTSERFSPGRMIHLYSEMHECQQWITHHPRHLHCARRREFPSPRPEHSRRQCTFQSALG